MTELVELTIEKSPLFDSKELGEANQQAYKDAYTALGVQHLFEAVTPEHHEGIRAIVTERGTGAILEPYALVRGMAYAVRERRRSAGRRADTPREAHDWGVLQAASTIGHTLLHTVASSKRVFADYAFRYADKVINERADGYVPQEQASVWQKAHQVKQSKLMRTVLAEGVVDELRYQNETLPLLLTGRLVLRNLQDDRQTRGREAVLGLGTSIEYVRFGNAKPMEYIDALPEAARSIMSVGTSLDAVELPGSRDAAYEIGVHNGFAIGVAALICVSGLSASSRC